jgi:hypothetical protein
MRTCRDCMSPVEPHVLRCDYHAAEMERALEMAGFDHRKSLDDALALCGLTSRATERTRTKSTQRREIVDAAGGVVAEMTAHEAWLWLLAGRPAPEAGR